VHICSSLLWNAQEGMSVQRRASLFSRWRTTGNLVYISGVTSRSEDGTIAGDTPTQIRNCFEKLKGILSDARSSLGNVVMVSVYLADLNDREKYLNDIWHEYFPINPPCRTTIQAGLRADVRAEIVAVAQKD
jgi:2-iminobutanoate/2-iminopropanoate deaminase